MSPAARSKRRSVKRPPDDRPAIVTAVCLKVATGVLVKTACKAAGISRDTLHRWIAEDAALSDLYTRARSDQAHAIAEEALTIADGKAATPEAVARNRLRVDTRKWLASKIAPRDYGEKVSAEITGKDGGPIEVRGSIQWGGVEIPL